MGEDRWERLLDRAWLERRVAAAGADRTWREAADLHACLDDLTRHLRAGRAEAVEGAIAFLTLDPVFFASGYAKVRLFRAIPHAPLTERQEEWFRAFVLRRCRERTRLNDMRGVRRLARAVATTGLVRELEALRPSTDPRARIAEERFIASVAEGARIRGR